MTTGLSTAEIQERYVKAQALMSLALSSADEACGERDRLLAGAYSHSFDLLKCLWSTQCPPYWLLCGKDIPVWDILASGLRGAVALSSGESRETVCRWLQEVQEGVCIPGSFWTRNEVSGALYLEAQNQMLAFAFLRCAAEMISEGDRSDRCVLNAGQLATVREAAEAFGRRQSTELKIKPLPELPCVRDLSERLLLLPEVKKTETNKSVEVGGVLIVRDLTGREHAVLAALHLELVSIAGQNEGTTSGKWCPCLGPVHHVRSASFTESEQNAAAVSGIKASLYSARWRLTPLEKVNSDVFDGGSLGLAFAMGLKQLLDLEGECYVDLSTVLPAAAVDASGRLCSVSGLEQKLSILPPKIDTVIVQADQVAEARRYVRDHVEVLGAQTVDKAVRLLTDLQHRRQVLHEGLLRIRDVPSFGNYLSGLRYNFVGREWVFKKTLNWLDSGETRGLVLIAPAGFGKSALVAELVHRYAGRRILAHHCCLASDSTTAEMTAFIWGLICIVAGSYTAYARKLDVAALHRDMANLQANQYSPSSLFRQWFVEKLPLESPDGCSRYLLVVDALDESIGRDGRSAIAKLLASHIRSFPSWLRILFTSRDDDRVLQTLGGLTQISLVNGEDAIDGTPVSRKVSNRRDQEVYIQKRFLEPALASRLRAENLLMGDVLDLLVKQSEGSFLYLVQALDDLANPEGKYTFATLSRLPPGLHNWYEGYMDRLLAMGGDFSAMRAVLESLVAAQAPLTLDLLTRASGLGPDELAKSLRQLAPHLKHSEEGAQPITYAIHYQRFRDWLTWDGIADPGQRDPRYLVDCGSGHRRLASVCLDWSQMDGEARLYALRWLPKHLIGDSMKLELLEILGNSDYRSAREPVASVRELREEFACAVREVKRIAVSGDLKKAIRTCMKLQGDVCDVIWRKLGSANLDVELLEIFVADSAWSQADQRLSVEEQAHILCNAGFSLRVLGRLEEAYNALLAGLTLDEGSADINSAASDVTNLAEIARDLGRLDDALAYAKKAEAIEPRQARKAWRWQTLGNILHMRGDMDAAASAFDHTGVSWSAGSYGAYVYGEYLLDCGRSRDVITALQTYRHRNPVEAVECLRLITLGRAYLMADAGGDRQQMVAEGARLLVDTVKWIAAEDHQFESLERGDLALGELAMVKGSWADAIVHAEKALRRSHASGARIYEIESRQILAAAFAQSDRLHDAAKERQLAEDLIQVTGYHRPRHWAWSDPLADMGRS